MTKVTLFLNAALIMVLIVSVAAIIYRIVSVRRVPVGICLFLILPIGQLLMLRSFTFEGWSVFWMSGLILGMAANVLFLFYAISQEKKTAVIEELRETHHRMELEKSHYEAVERRRLELEKIRLDFHDKLATVAEMVRLGENGEARENISAFAEKINRTKENPYCAIPIINAVLTQKAQDCHAVGISLAVDLRLPASLTVESMHLCSIFGNILDNAIAACQKLKCAKLKGADKPVIHLTADMEGDYLFIKTANPSGEPNRNPIPGHGYGQRIISELAKQYDGYFRSEYSNGTYTAVVSLTAVVR